MPRRALTVLFVALLQAAVTVILAIIVFGSNMSRWDTGAESPPVIRAAGLAVTVLGAPLLTVVALLPNSLQPSGFPAEHLLFFANGLVWALCLDVARQYMRRRQARRE